MKVPIFPAYFFAAISLTFACRQASGPAEVNEPCVIEGDSVAIASKLLTLSDAEKIMGEPAELTCNTFVIKGDTSEYKCDYTALSQDTINRKTGKLYFMYEAYATVDAAKNAYVSIYQANRTHEGVEMVTGLGDEAYYHTDGTAFYFFLVRKGAKMFRMKLNKITSHSSETEFKNVAKHVADTI